MIPRIWKTGERCTITCAGRTVEGTIVLASGNGLSIMLSFDAILSGHVGAMPLMWDQDAREFRSIVNGESVQLS